MYELIRRLTLKQFTFELPVFLVALAIAELFYKFWQARGGGAEVSIDVDPCCGSGAIDVLGTVTKFDTFRIRQGIEGGTIRNRAAAAISGASPMRPASARSPTPLTAASL